MKTIATKIFILLLFILAGITGWAAFAMVFSAGLYNIVLGIVSIFFFVQALDLVDRLNKLGNYAPDDKKLPEEEFRRPTRHREEEDIPGEETTETE